MSGSKLRAGIIRIYLTTALIAAGAGMSYPALADQKTNPEPVRTTLPAGESLHESKLMMAPLMSADERNALYLQWGLTFAVILAGVSGVVIWVFLNTRKETEEEEGREEENAYSVPTVPHTAEEPTAVAATAPVIPATLESSVDSEADKGANKSDS